jgi:hypothetical protein
MRYQRLSATLLALISWITPSPANQGSIQVPCEISYGTPFVVICDVTISAIEGWHHVVETVRTPNGKAFVIENENKDGFSITRRRSSPPKTITTSSVAKTRRSKFAFDKEKIDYIS